MQAKKSHKKEKLEDRFLKEINDFLRKDFTDQRLRLVTVTKVEMNPDYSLAKIFWDSFVVEDKGQTQKALQNIQGRLRSLLAKIIKMRHIPQLVFFYDSQFEAEKHITDILQSESASGKYSGLG